jgi:excisionase family DNA binding protein
VLRACRGALDKRRRRAVAVRRLAVSPLPPVSRSPLPPFAAPPPPPPAADGRKLYLTAEDTAAHFGVSLHAVLAWCKLGVLPEYRIGGRIYLNREEVVKYWAMFQKRR